LSSNEVLKYREKVLKYKYIRELLVCSVTGTMDHSQSPSSSHDSVSREVLVCSVTGTHRHHNCTM